MQKKKMQRLTGLKTPQITTRLVGTILTTTLLIAATFARAEDAPKQEAPKQDAPKTDKAVAKQPQPLQVARLQDAPKTDAPKTDTSKQDAPKQDATKEVTKPAVAQAPAAPAPTPPGTLTYSGLVDVYYAINARAPHSAGSLFSPAYTGILTPSGEKIRIDNAGRSFDINDRDLGFSLGEFNITRTEGKGFPVGFTATLTVGDTARLVHATEPGGTSSWQTIQQLYVTKTLPIKNHDIAFDAGIFVTPFGYEVIEISSNDNYSRSFGFQYGVPFYHAGFRATLPLTPKLQLLGALVNGWNNIADDNDGKSALVQLTWKPGSQFTGIFGFMGGSEGTGAYGPGLAPKDKAGLNTYLYEFEPIYQVNAKLKLAGDVIYGNAAGHTIVGGGGQGHVSGDWVGLAGYLRYQLTPRLAFAGRLEQFEDIPGAGGAGLRLGIPGYAKLSSTTGTLEYTFLRSHLLTRLEYRHDHSNAAFFGASSNAVREQDTVTASAVYKF